METDRRRPEHEAIYLRVRHMILVGDLAPGQPITIHGLAENLSAGVTPVREAIRRLTAERALEMLNNRRICVPDITLDKLNEIKFLRLSVEPELARRGGKNLDIQSIKKMQDLDEHVNDAIDRGDIGQYLEANYLFHFELYKHANAPTLFQVVESLWLQIGPALRVCCGRVGTSNLTDQHFQATQALVRGDVNAVAQAFHDDILQGLDMVAQSLKQYA